MYYAANNQDGFETPYFDTVNALMTFIQDEYGENLIEWDCYEQTNNWSRAGEPITFTCVHTHTYGLERTECENAVPWPGMYCTKHGGE